jgi:hypothetical protein
LRDHHGQQSIGSDIEWNAQEYIRTALVKLATELAVSHIELEKSMAWRQFHPIHVSHIPRRNNKTS